MNAPFIIALSILIFGSCVKQQTKDPVPEIEFLEFAGAGKSKFTNSDTATIVLSYEDGDGDLFVDNFSEGPNIVITTFAYDEATNTFKPPRDLASGEILRYTNTIKQPDNGYYKGKAIKGRIYVPLNEFRENETVKILKFEVFMIDRKNNKSNIAASPVYTLNF